MGWMEQQVAFLSDKQEREKRERIGIFLRQKRSERLKRDWGTFFKTGGNKGGGENKCGSWASKIGAALANYYFFYATFFCTKSTRKRPFRDTFLCHSFGRNWSHFPSSTVDTIVEG